MTTCFSTRTTNKHSQKNNELTWDPSAISREEVSSSHSQLMYGLLVHTMVYIIIAHLSYDRCDHRIGERSSTLRGNS